MLSLRSEPVGVERGREVETEILEQRGAQRHGDVRQPHRIGEEVIGPADAQLVDELDFPDARGVALGEHLHFEVLRERETQRHGTARRGDRIGVAGVGRIGGETARGVDLPRAVVTVFLMAEVGRVGEAERRAEGVADRLDLAVAVLLGEVIHAVDGGRRRDARPVVVKAVGTRIAWWCRSGS